jgi:subtilisin family serine protease
VLSHALREEFSMRRTATAIGAALLVVAGVCPVRATAEAPPGPVESRSVTLITGDTVVVEGSTVSVLPGPGRAGMGFRRRSKGNRVSVVPDDAAPLIRAGTLDRRLFDVTALVARLRDGEAMPLIVTRNVAPTAVTAALPSIDAVAVRADRAALAELWDSVRTRPGAKVWLDGQATLDDAESHAQIGAPEAWKSGYTGKGVTVAVLDSGYDDTHPDLAGVVVEAKDFTGSGIKDTYGHGTHVASTIAGSGPYGGAAPYAKLLIGKVCGGRICDYSAILAAMEWAAPRADVVNLSLGDEATDGTDPLSLAVDRLSERYGTLFVVAAGNNGDPRSVGTPAAADAALAVGSVDKTDQLSVFSSRGPRLGDYAVKPDLAAPGEAIGAARAAGTDLGTPIDALHVRLDGTSMATPHVAASAALLAQRHPDWTGAQLKAALTSSAEPTPGADSYAEGSGRVDVAAAVNRSVYASPAGIGFGFLKFPHTLAPAVPRTLTYRNDSADPVTLSLAVDDPAIVLSTPQLTVPGKGSADLVATLQPSLLPPSRLGSQSARITAVGAGEVVRTALGAGEVVRTALGFTTEAESFDVTITAVDRTGAPATGSPTVLGLDSEFEDEPILVDGTATLHLPRGGYALDFIVATPADGSRTLVSVPRFTADRAVAITLDARQGREIGAVLDRPARLALAQFDTIHLTRTPDEAYATHTSYRIQGTPPLYAVPVQGRPEDFEFGVHQVRSTAEDTYYLAFPSVGSIPANLNPRVRDRDLGAERTRYRAQGVPEIGSRSSVPVYLPSQHTAFASTLDLPLPSRRTEHYSPGEAVAWTMDLFQRPADVPTQIDLDGHLSRPRQHFRAGRSADRTWNSAVAGADLSLRPANGVSRTGDALDVGLWPFAPGESDESDEFDFGSPRIVSALTLRAQDGRVIGSSQEVKGTFALPAQPGRYTLDVAASRGPKWTVYAPEVRTRWSFTSARTMGKQYPPLLTVRTTGAFDDRNRAPGLAWFPLSVTVVPQAGSTIPATVKEITVRTSTDDGRTWRSAPVIGNGGKWHALVKHTKGAQFVSLNVKAVDTAGNSVEQTTTRAYGVTS